MTADQFLQAILEIIQSGAEVRFSSRHRTPPDRQSLQFDLYQEGQWQASKIVLDETYDAESIARQLTECAASIPTSTMTPQSTTNTTVHVPESTGLSPAAIQAVSAADTTTEVNLTSRS